MKQRIEKLIEDALKRDEKFSGLKLPKIEISRPKGEQFGDYSTNLAMVLAKKIGKNPLEIADEIAGLLKGKIVEVEKTEAVNPGFINFYLNKESLVQNVLNINREKENFGSLHPKKKEKIMVEFVSANPTGPIHLGNGRGGPIGDTLANVLEKAGNKVWREYYVNDFGNQVKILGHSILKDEKAQYNGDYIDELAKRIGEGDPFEVGQEAAGIILEEIIKPSMENAGIKFDQYFSEKTLHDGGEIEEAFSELKEKNLIYEKEGALWFKATQFGDEKDRVIKKSTGEISYFGGDIAYHRNKFKRGFDKVIDIWGADHHGDVKRVMGAMEALGHGGKLKIILNQFVRVIKDGKEFKMSKRAGTYVSLSDLVEEAGKDAVRFFFLMHSPQTHIDFDLDLAKEKSDKNPVYYVQYAHARISSIIEKAKIESLEIDGKTVDGLEHEKEVSLIRELSKFPELVEEIFYNYEVHKLSYYAMGLADKFHSFYGSCKVIDLENKELSRARLNLINAVRIVLKETLRLMGVSAPNKM